jgi:glycosyltransferase involved in cell wall biosynthesis
LRILIAHNRYKLRGGEDMRSEEDAQMLRERGHYVYQYAVDNDSIGGSFGLLTLPARTIWSQRDYRAIREIIRRERIDVVHVHNYLPLLSPAVFHAAHDEGIPSVFTVHNYRQICPGAQLLRDGKICEDCIGKFLPYPGVLHSCYRGSMMASAAVAASLTAHKLLCTWSKKVDAYIVLTEFSRQKLSEGGVPANKMYYRPNFALDNGAGDGSGNYALFVGRLTHEKGLDIVLEAWKKIGTRLPLKIAGDGPMRGAAEKAAREMPGVQFLGQVPREQIYELMGSATLVLIPSLWYEGAPAVIMEAFAKGTPAVVSRLGGMASMVDHGRTGLCFDPGSSEALLLAVLDIVSDTERYQQMRRNARLEYEHEYTEQVSYDKLLTLYEGLHAGLPISSFGPGGGDSSIPKSGPEATT